MSKRLQGVIAGAVLLGVGVPLGVHGKGVLADATASADWPAVTGVVDRSEISEHRGRRGRRSYDAQIEYGYEVQGRSYHGDTVAFGFDSSSLSHAQAVAAHYPRGARVQVFYDPADPERSVLEPGVTGGSYAWLAIGAGMALVGLVVLGWPVAARAIAARRSAARSGGTFPPEPQPVPPRGA